MKKRIIAIALSFVLPLPILLTFSSCSIVSSDNLMSNIKANDIGEDIDNSSKDDKVAVMDFAVRLFKNSTKDGESTLISPVSVINALAMTANGARANTLTQMEEVLGLPIQKLNEYLYTYRTNLPTDKKYKFNIANSIWLRDDGKFNVNQDFLQTNADFYNAGIFKAPFDSSTVKDINSWVNNNTDNMIKNILNEISDNAVMYLINAIAFDAEWQDIYYEKQVQDGIFTKENGETQDIKLMYSTEDKFLQDNKATGFIKYYADRKYAFVALLPNEGVDIKDYVSSLTGDRLSKILSNVEDTNVRAAIPKFKFEYSVELSDILMNMGISDAFNYNLSDFSGIGTVEDANLSISSVLHKTYIALDEKGTKAGAATIVEIKTTSALEPQKEQIVYLDRPFVYIIMDCETNLPIFIGTVMDINK